MEQTKIYTPEDITILSDKIKELERELTIAKVAVKRASTAELDAKWKAAITGKICMPYTPDDYGSYLYIQKVFVDLEYTGEKVLRLSGLQFYIASDCCRIKQDGCTEIDLRADGFPEYTVIDGMECPDPSGHPRYRILDASAMVSKNGPVLSSIAESLRLRSEKYNSSAEEMLEKFRREFRTARKTIEQ